jgi:uncharacterized membrane protein (TIGR02234 family)
MRSKRTVTLGVLVPAVVLLAATGQTWVSGRTTDAVLGSATVTVSGSQAVPAALALVLVAVAALLALMTGGRRVRVVSGVVLVLTTAGAVASILGPITDPSGALGRRAAQLAGRTGALPAQGSLVFWAWLAGFGAVAMLAAAVLAVRAARSWSGLTGRFERPESGGSGPLGARRTDWDAISDGHDPTHEPRAERT